MRVVLEPTVIEENHAGATSKDMCAADYATVQQSETRAHDASRAGKVTPSHLLLLLWFRISPGKEDTSYNTAVRLGPSLHMGTDGSPPQTCNLKAPRCIRSPSPSLSLYMCVCVRVQDPPSDVVVIHDD